MWVYENDTALTTFIIDLKEDRDVQDNLPCNFLAVRNNSSLVADIYLNSKRVGAVQAYSADSFIGKNFEVVMIKQPDEDDFDIGDLFVQIGKNEQMSSMPYNPSWDLMEENIDVYASGCDKRISLSATNTTDVIKYWINAQNNLIVQRRLSVQGSASLGTYAITFDTETILSGGVPINGEVLDTKQYKKVIENSEFDCSVTNASIKGWMIDYKDIDISNNYTEVSCVGTPSITLSFDNDLSTYTDTGMYKPGSSFVTMWEVSFPSRTINNVSTHLKVQGWTSTAYVIVEIKVNGTWIQIIDDSITGSAKTASHHYNTSHDKVTGIRYRGRQSVAGNNYELIIYDITAN